MRLVLAPVGSRGDVEPMLALGARMQGRGHDVLAAAPPDCRALVESRGLAFAPVGADVGAWAAANAQGSRGGGLTVFRGFNRFMREQLALQLEALLEVAQGADVVVGEALQMAAPTAAEAVGAAYRYLVYSPIYLQSDRHAPVLVPRYGLPRAVNRAAWTAYRAFYNKLLRDDMDRLRASIGLEGIQDVYSSTVGITIVAADPELAPVPADARAGTVQTGFWMAPDDGPLDPGLDAWLDAGPPPVFFGFGSMPDPDPAATTRCLIDAALAVGRRAVISRGCARLGAEEDLPDTIRLVDEAPFARLFARVGAVVHHGGTGTTNLAARAGVPQVIVPHLADQPYFGWRAHRLGIGPRPIPRARVTVATLARAVDKALGSAEMRLRAQRLAADLAGRDGVGEGVQALERITAASAAASR
jgi:UDP:flavonoid glycosyltransferase YjiC (YdhE family)